jgi:hypothetical protein
LYGSGSIVARGAVDRTWSPLTSLALRHASRLFLFNFDCFISVDLVVGVQIPTKTAVSIRNSSKYSKQQSVFETAVSIRNSSQ